MAGTREHSTVARHARTAPAGAQELDRQVATLVDRGYPAAAGCGEEELAAGPGAPWR